MWLCCKGGWGLRSPVGVPYLIREKGITDLEGQLAVKYISLQSTWGHLKPQHPVVKLEGISGNS